MSRHSIGEIITTFILALLAFCALFMVLASFLDRDALLKCKDAAILSAPLTWQKGYPYCHATVSVDGTNKMVEADEWLRLKEVKR